MDLETLVAPLSSEAFLRDHWPDTPYVSPDGTGRLAALTSVPELDDLERLIGTSSRVNFFAPDGSVVEAEHPMKLYRLGLTCYFSCQHVAALTAIASALARDLGVPDGAITCEAFCSSGDSGVKMHSDRDLNFAVLVRGHKRWHIAANQHIRNQTSLCRPSSAGVYDAFQLELADEVPFPTRMPDDAQEIDVDAGGLLFLPRGWWHETEANGECLQVNFVMNRPMWVDVLTRALRERLIHEPEWRAMAFDVTSTERRQNAVERFAALLEELTATLGKTDVLTLASDLIDDAKLRVPRDGDDD